MNPSEEINHIPNTIYHIHAHCNGTTVALLIIAKYSYPYFYFIIIYYITVKNKIAAAVGRDSILLYTRYFVHMTIKFEPLASMQSLQSVQTSMRSLIHLCERMWVYDLPFIYHSLLSVSTTKAQTAMITKMTVHLDPHEHCMSVDFIQSNANNMGLAVY